MVINRVENSDKSVEDWNSDGDGSGCSTGLAGTPCFTSRLYVLKAASVIAQFSEFKRQLVSEIGFGGMLELKSWQKINLKYSAYLMDRVDLDSCSLNLESQEQSTETEKHCFKIAFVIFIIGHVLAPTAKHDYISVDFWAALNDVNKIKDWNWGVFVLDNLELGLLNKQQGVTPRIGLYDYESMKKMVEQITVNIPGGEVTFSGGKSAQKLGILLREQNARGLANISEMR
ncbi:hypothetical protein CFC21_051114 [Triticum aestivum]|uniref:Aminotransferase-like plant mobile domain-containing protein n=3 Tax=Triticum TaxID=4564 RepID=A0A9R0S374_TRITD|nr:hypothetical protein CFC21_051114 [Triticum aestivum]VAH87567.1 unnamed protein product [Triticum turgidum subsp. durum]